MATKKIVNKGKEVGPLEKKVLKLVKDYGLSDSEMEATIKYIKGTGPVTGGYFDHSTKQAKKRGRPPAGTKDITLRLMHPGKGTAYALSYQPQKWAESISGGDKPSIAALGHYHKIEQLFYRNIHIFQTGTFEEQTPFMQRRNIAAMLGGWILWVNDLEPFALVGDTHLGSKHHRNDLLTDFYEKAMGHGVTNFYHTGDIVSGENVYRGQVYEIYAHGFEAQASAVVNEYPKYKDVTTYFILGNHDLSFAKRAGANIGIRIDELRDDLVYLGNESADIQLGRDNVVSIKSLLIPYYD